MIDGRTLTLIDAGRRRRRRRRKARTTMRTRLSLLVNQSQIGHCIIDTTNLWHFSCHLIIILSALMIE